MSKIDLIIKRFKDIGNQTPGELGIMDAITELERIQKLPARWRDELYWDNQNTAFQECADELEGES